jgi:predicted AAA+ superfamily ATPase
VIKREIYLKKLRGYKDKKLIKVITGIRRCGKSTLLDMFRDELRESGIAHSNIISINFEDMNYNHLLEAKILHNHLLEQLVEGMNYIFLDEIQMVPEYERVLDSLYIRKNVDLYVTGSNANMLSGELATLLSGRYVEIFMLPLSLSEFSEGLDEGIINDHIYNRYLEVSSFPYALELKDDENLRRGYLEGVFNTVILKDVVTRKRIKDAMMLDSVIRFLFDSIGSIVSIKKISDTMTSMGRKISTHTVESYIQGLMESYIVYQVKRYDLKGKQHLKTHEKYYVADLGLRYLLLGRKRTDIGHILENVVYLELLRRGYEVYIGKVAQMEVDFVARTNEETIYIQVAATVRSEETYKREIKSLKAINDSYPKFILTLDNDPKMNDEGIWIMNAVEFMMEK